MDSWLITAGLSVAFVAGVFGSHFGQLAVEALQTRRDTFGAVSYRLGELRAWRGPGPPGVCRVSGTIERRPVTAGLVTAPASQRACVAFRTTLLHFYPDGEGGADREIVWETCSHGRVFLVDGGRSAQLHDGLLARGVGPWPEHDPWEMVVVETSPADALGPALTAAVDHGVPSPTGLPGTSASSLAFRLVEEVIPPETEVHVLAEVERDHGVLQLLAPRRHRHFVSTRTPAEIDALVTENLRRAVRGAVSCGVAFAAAITLTIYGLVNMG